MLKNNRLTLILTSIVTLLPIPIGLLVHKLLPDTMAIHWGLNGVANGFAGKNFAIFVLPLILLAFHWICTLFTVWDNKRREQSPKVIRMVLWICPVISLFTSSFIYLSALGITGGISAITLVMIGIVFIVIGNYLPKTRQNRTIGIKISWTLGSEANWNATHRMAGKLWMICGLVMLFSALLPLKLSLTLLFAVILVAVIIPVIYSYRFYKRELAEGKNPELPKATKKSLIVSLIMSVLVIIVVIPLLFTGDIRYVQGENELMIDGSFGNKTYVEYSEIESVELIENADFGVREYGFGSPRLLMGRFRNDEYGGYSLYAYAKNHVAIKLTLKGGILVINHETRDKTVELFEGLKNRID
ncbi:MAG: SdpI family protein [Clostridia bacterium]|nr:SdpI family protein [Clostridia bacterium]